MTLLEKLLIFGTVALAGIGPFIAVHRGGSAYEFGDEPEAEPPECSDATAQISRITVDTDDPYMY